MATKDLYQHDFSKIPLLGLVPESSPTAPANPAAGQLWTDTSLTPPCIKYYDGSAWHRVDEILDGSITDAKIGSGAAIALSKLATNPLARANHTGSQAASTISDFDAQVRTSRLDQLAAPTADVSVGGKKVTNVADPTAATDATNKQYVDTTVNNARAGISVKDPVRVVASGNVNLASPGATIDGVTMAAGDRFLAPDQNAATQNGIYQYNGPSAPATRAYDAQSGDVVDGTLVAVAEGSAAGEQWIQTASTSSDPHWVVFLMGGQSYTAGSGLALSGTQFSLPTVPVTSGGTGATTAEGARDNLFAAGAYAETVVAGDFAVGVPVTVTHGLNTKFVGVFTTVDSTGERVELNWKSSGANDVQLSVDVAISDDINVLVVGV